MATEIQRIARLTPLADVLARIDALVEPVAAREVDLAAALGRTLAADVTAAARPAMPLVLRDGWAVASQLTTDASDYAPVPLAAPPAGVDVGDTLPAGADAVAPVDSVILRDGSAEIIAAVAPGDGVLAKGGDTGTAAIARAGRRLGFAQHAALAALGVQRVPVTEPRVQVLAAGTPGDPVLDAAAQFVAAAAEAQGAVVSGQTRSLAKVLTNTDADAAIVIGGTGSGRHDASVHTLAQVGRLEVHGIALLPGETAAFGAVGQRPVLLVPGRIDAAIAVWLTLGRHLLARLCGNNEQPPATTAVLARKIASPLGFAEVVPVRYRDGKAEPIASGYWPLSVIAQADGWIFVRADSEGYPAGSEVVLRPWP
jgi:molybdopterin biosynthesis enzyme